MAPDLFRQTMDLDSQLKRLAVEAQSYPPKTLERQKALSSLICAIQSSGKLMRPYRGQFGSQYEEIYAEAVQRLYFHMCMAIEQYNPDKAVLQWANFLLKKRFFIEASRDIISSPKGADGKYLPRGTEEEADRNPVVEVDSLSEQVRQCIEEDCEGLFEGTHVQDKPAANFQCIALQVLSGYSWKEIAATLQVKVPTLSCFYQRSLSKFVPKFREYLSK